MKNLKKVVAIAGIICAPVIGFSQEVKDKNASLNNVLVKNEIISKNTQKPIDSLIKPHKNDTNKSIKYAPEAFYIVNDKPVDLETYQRHQRSLSKKESK